MGSRVLLADDSVTIQKVVGIIFANEDYELTVVDSGDAALQKAREIMPDVMLIDALMPGRNGYEVCNEIRRDPRLSHIALLLMTGAFEVVDEEKNRQSGADDFITKPFESQALIDITARLIALSRERAATAVAAQALAPPVVEPAAPVVAPPIVPAAPAAVEDVWGSGFEADFSEEIQPLQANVAAAPQGAPASEEDLWGAFDMDTVELQPATPAAASPQAAPAAAAEEFFSFEEEPATAAPQPVAAPVPVAEATPAAFDEFSFGDVTFEEPAPAAAPGAATGFEPFGEQEFSIEGVEPLPVQAAAPVPLPEEDFSSISFEEPAPAPPQPAAPAPSFAPPEPPAAAVAPPPVFAPEIPPVAQQAAAAPAAAAAAVPEPLGEEQLKGLLASVSRDVIERIVWEVVPDLAEAIIREEIRKIKEGIGR